ncbi:SbmA/BacA-like family transporter [Bradyrhizobium genomosp. I (2014)]|uniref:SbmA/BacA-like family transporter n=1 Tax=Bradyrhizobium TaxID=374 RepID=UPI003F7CDFC8
MMTEPDQNGSSRERSRFWQSASGFWRGAPAWRVWVLCVVLVIVVVLQLYVQFRFNYWNRDFFDALESRDPARLKGQAFLLVPLCVGSIALAVTSVWGRMTVQRRWREWLTGKVIDYWVENDRYARLAFVQSERQIPEYRIAEDVRIATDAPIDLALGLVSALLSAVIFIQVLWTVGGDIALPVGSHSVRIPGYLVVGVALYSSIVTSAMMTVGAPLTRLVQIKNQAEAELITAAHQLRDIGEGIAPKGQQPEVCRDLRKTLRTTIDQWRRLCWQLMRTTIVSHGNSLLAPIIGLVLCAPKFLSGAMTLGELTQAAAAFTLVQASFNWVVDNYGRIADWMSSLERVGGLLLSLDRLNRDTPPGQVEAPTLPTGSVKLP